MKHHQKHPNSVTKLSQFTKLAIFGKVILSSKKIKKNVPAVQSLTNSLGWQ
jgi:hypothetical protein